MRTAASRVFVAGHGGLLGSATVRALAASGEFAVVTRTRAELDLRETAGVEAFFSAERPEMVVLAAARVGGIAANLSEPASFLADNLRIQTAVLEAAQRHGVRRLLFVASGAMYPQAAASPIAETALFCGPLDPALRAYGLAKLAGVELCGALNRQHGTRFLAVAPCNLYGPGDRFDAARGGVLAALLSRAQEAVLTGAAAMEVWGTGGARRELLYVDDAAAALVHLLRLSEDEFGGLLGGEWPLANLGAGEDVSIRELAGRVAREAGFAGELRFDASKPEGAQRRLLDSSRLRATGWIPRVGLDEGIRRTAETVFQRDREGEP